VRTRADILTELAVIRAKRGESKAFEILVNLWQPRLGRNALRLLGDSEAASDVMQEVWLAVSRGIRRLDDPARFRSWIYRIVRNKCADWIRSEQARRRMTEQLAEEADSNSDGDRSDDAPIDTLRSLIRELPEEQRSILTLFYLEEMHVREIGFVLGIPDGTVKSRLYHARQMLKEALED